MENSDVFIGLFLIIGAGFSVMAVWARGLAKVERQSALARRQSGWSQDRDAASNALSVADYDRRIAYLTEQRERLVRNSARAKRAA